MNEIPDILKEGKTLASVYLSIKDRLMRSLKDVPFEVQKSFGHGIGLEFKEKLLDINETNTLTVQKYQT